jgi:peptidoglycan/LPS O-acetylase OafA/YrhL
MENRSRPLDLLRAAAILLVLGAHLIIYPKSNLFLHAVTIVCNKTGWIGVDLFFVLSGFLISGLLFSEYDQFKHISFKRFFIRRGFKIYPSFYMFTFACLLYFIITKKPVGIKSCLPWLFYLQDYIRPSTSYLGKFFWGHTWSLAVEEQFYLFLPLLLILLYKVNHTRKQPFWHIPAIFIITGAACLILRIWAIKTNSIDPYTFPVASFHLRMDALLFGVLISYFYHYYFYEFEKAARRFKYALVGIGLILLLLVPWLQWPINNSIGYSLAYLGSGLILAGSMGQSIKTNIFTKMLSGIGRYSYSIYLWHFPIAMSVIPYLKRAFSCVNNWFVYATIYLAGSIAIGILMSKAIEIPLLNLRDRIYPSRSKTIIYQKQL